MTSSQRSKLAALGVFFLIAVLVIGGMAWATIVTFRLAEVDIREQRRYQIRRAVTSLDKSMQYQLQREIGRPYSDYVEVFTTDMLAGLSVDGRIVDCNVGFRQSEISISGPPHDWIELYFQVDDGRWSSPQSGIDDPTTSGSTSPTVQRLRETFAWLQAELPMVRLSERVAQATARDRTLAGRAPLESESRVVTVSQRLSASPGESDAMPSRDYWRRSVSKLTAQLASVPSPQCLHPELHETQPAGLDFQDSLAESDHGAAPQVSAVSVSPEPAAVFWLEDPRRGGGTKLLFVRTATRDEKPVYQGFLGDWSRLKERLLEEIGDLLPSADLEPLARADVEDVTLCDTDMTWIPARLKVPEATVTVERAAWRQVGGTLISSWLAAVVVLGMAGWGVRNLVALTERRMQFAYAVTHELRTPLTTFRLYSDMLSSGMVPEESKEQYLTTLNHESERLTSLVESVLEYARLENHKVRLNPTTMTAGALRDRIAETLERRCRDCELEARMVNEVPPELPLRLDADVVSQIAGVLINNSCRHTRGKTPGVVMARMSIEGERLHVDVIDTGPGIDRSDARVIFKPFRRGRQADSVAQGGVGLGLALARNWARLLNGSLELAARRHGELGGAHFRLTVPTSTPA